MLSPSSLGKMSSLESYIDECALKSPAIIWFGPRFRQAVSVWASIWATGVWRVIYVCENECVFIPDNLNY